MDDYEYMETHLDKPSVYIEVLRDRLAKLDLDVLQHITDALLEAYSNSKTVFIFGNGGSGMTASHIAGDYIKGVSFRLEKKFKMICLNDNYTALTAFANDVNYDYVFVEPLKNFLETGDVVIGLSGSGNSKNVVLALEYARSKHAVVVGFSGYNGGKVKELSDLSVHVDVQSMEISEDIHMAALHIIKNKIISKLHGGLGKNLGAEYLKRI